MLPSPADQGSGLPDRRKALSTGTSKPSMPSQDHERGPRGLYAITPDQASPLQLLPLIDQALAGGIDALQFRVKRAPLADPERSASALRDLALQVKLRCDAFGVPLIINDDLELACEIGARGVHLGRDDGDPAAARQRLGKHRWLGVSCYNDFDRAVAVSAWADHVGFGSLFASSTKPAAVRAPLSLFARARSHDLHAVGIGGINRDNAAQVMEAGAQAVAVIADLFEDPDPAQAARSIRSRIQPGP